MPGFWMMLGLLAGQGTVTEPAEVICPGQTTIALNACAQRDVSTARLRMERYLEAAKTRLRDEDRDELVALIDASQTSWQAYASNECAALYENWKDGTIRGLFYANCQRMLIEARTHVLWENWLQYMDSTPPILPEPAALPDSNASEP